MILLSSLTSFSLDIALHLFIVVLRLAVAHQTCWLHFQAAVVDGAEIFLRGLHQLILLLLHLHELLLVVAQQFRM